MIIGDDRTFAIKIEVGKHTLPTSLQPCNFCYLIAGQEVGNFDFEAPEYEIYLELSDILSYRGQRRNTSLWGKEKNNVVSAIREGLSENNDIYRPHVLSYYMGHGYPPEVGQRWEIYIVENEGSARLFYAEQSSPFDIFEVNIEANFADSLLAQCTLFLEKRFS